MRDLRWMRQAYAPLPSIQHHVVLHQGWTDLRCYDRPPGWTERRLQGPDAALPLEAIGATLWARDLYAGTGLL